MNLCFSSQFSDFTAGFNLLETACSLILSYTRSCCQSLLTPLILIAALLMVAGAGLPKRAFSIVEWS